MNINDLKFTFLGMDYVEHRVNEYRFLGYCDGWLSEHTTIIPVRDYVFVVLFCPDVRCN